MFQSLPKTPALAEFQKADLMLFLSFLESTRT